MPKRRTTILGLGALAMGSGAAFTSAAFQNSVEADADMRVVVDEQLTARAGEKFDDLSDDPSGVEFDDETTFIAKVPADGSATPSDVLFDGDTTVDGLTTVTADDSSNRIETPAAVVNDGENEEFAFAIATGINEEVTYEELIEIENETEDTADVGITFSEFGDDASQVTGSPGGEEAVATEIYEFAAADDSDTSQISTDSSGWEGADDQSPADRLDVSPGDTKQISLINDTGGGSVSVGDIRSAVAGGTPAFGETLSDVDLVDEIEIGVGES